MLKGELLKFRVSIELTYWHINSLGCETMPSYTVGVKLGARTKAVTIEAEDALVAALKIKLENPFAQFR